MRYRGQIGELKPFGFIIAIIVLTVIALLLYKRFDFVTDTKQEDTKSTIDQLTRKIDTLQQQDAELTKELHILQDRINRLEQAKRGTIPKSH